MMIKPSSSKCNLNCKYCFYNSIAEARYVKDYGFMEDKVLEEIVRKSIEYCNGGYCNIGFQGGEPTLIGIDFYRKLIMYIEKYNNNNTIFNFVIQTNGILLDEEWVDFFKENKFLVGISLDGIKDVHNLNRIDHRKDDTHKDVMNSIKLLKKANVDFNILVVVTSVLARRAKASYRFFKEKGFKYLQFIPCLDPIEKDNKDYGKYSPSGEEYGNFLNEIFDMWYKDIKSGEQISIRYFDNLIRFFLGCEYEACDMRGICSCQNIIESDGTVYPCDFYAYEKYKIGNIMDSGFEEIHKNKKVEEFIKYSMKSINKECLECKYMSICRGGCRRYKENQDDNKNILCHSYRKFLNTNLYRLQEIAFLLGR